MVFDCWFDDIIAWFTEQTKPVSVSILLAGYTVLGVISPGTLQEPSMGSILPMFALGTVPALFLLVSYTPLVQLWWRIEDLLRFLPDPDDADDDQLRRHAVAWSLVITASAAFGTAVRVFVS